MHYNLLKSVENIWVEPKKRKTSADFPQFQFRISEEEKERIQNQLEKLMKLMNSKIGKEDRPFKKNEVIIDALKRGMASLEKEYK